MNAKRIKFALKLAISTGLISWLLTSALQLGLLKRASEINLSLAAIAALFHLLGFMILLLRWQLILGIYHKMTLRSLIRSFYIGLFSTNFLPSNVGGDLVRASVLVKEGIGISALLLSTVADRLIGVIVTIGLCLFSLSYFSINHFENIIPLDKIYAACVIFGIVLVTALPTIKFVMTKALWVRKFRTIYSSLEKALQLIETIKRKPSKLIGAILLSMSSTAAIILCYYFIGLSLGINITLSVLFIIVPLSFIASATPLSIGGLGIREGATVFLLSRFEVPTEHAIALTVIYLLILILVTAPGGLLILTNTKHPAKVLRKP
jgi:uncharacterized protein (TIRG00374 family)